MGEREGVPGGAQAMQHCNRIRIRESDSAPPRTSIQAARKAAEESKQPACLDVLQHHLDHPTPAGYLPALLSALRPGLEMGYQRLAAQREIQSAVPPPAAAGAGGKKRKADAV